MISRAKTRPTFADVVTDAYGEQMINDSDARVWMIGCLESESNVGNQHMQSSNARTEYQLGLAEGDDGNTTRMGNRLGVC